jgi:hypothetical protein
MDKSLKRLAPHVAFGVQCMFVLTLLTYAWKVQVVPFDLLVLKLYNHGILGNYDSSGNTFFIFWETTIGMPQVCNWFAMYVAVWFWGRDVVAFMRRLKLSAVISPIMLWAFLFLLPIIPHVKCDQVTDWCTKSDLLVVFLQDFFYTLVLVTAISFANNSWLHRSGLVRIGNASLGAYILSYTMIAIDLEHGGAPLLCLRAGLLGLRIPDMVQALLWMKPHGGSMGQLLILLVYPAVFSLTFGACFQKAFVALFMRIERGTLRLLQLIQPAFSSGK